MNRERIRNSKLKKSTSELKEAHHSSILNKHQKGDLYLVLNNGEVVVNSD